MHIISLNIINTIGIPQYQSCISKCGDNTFTAMNTHFTINYENKILIQISINDLIYME